MRDDRADMTAGAGPGYNVVIVTLDAHAAGPEGIEQRTVLKLAHDARANALLLKPVVQAGPHGGVGCG